ncbi:MULTISPECIES: Lrp/AsnC family transcriptional regulator [Streptomyces]|uniref:Lrp/AsnC family transcriptional regulator n=1 Tax=Streptomyces TaxID=1883 RepID=UPI001B38F3EE|nr:MULTISPECIES: Lrp/AsnC family transcriptional regulator [unclassified Streptomyces]MBQ1115528.1 Lrp/AsnC family transcriptional regulator [Streptomyces sp. C3-3]MDQ0693794.1 DNA-binding Lrp family transcriptional regulator [Streptomyces sp. W4I9-2]MDX3484977.1 Lrp/AsnC family transcriptional regulator [Streptomyces sp. ID05-18]
MTQYSAHGQVRTLDDVDQALVHALQIAPRAGWNEIGAVLGLDAVTVARRWHRLTEAGAAWISCSPSPALASAGQGLLAFVEVDCAGGSLLTVAQALAKLPHVTAVEHVSGDRDLLLTVMAPDLAALTHWMTRGIGAMPGVVASRAHLASTVYTEGSRWRLRALDRTQIAHLTDTDTARTEAHVFPLTDLDYALIAALSMDGRATYRALADACGASPDTVRRRLGRLFAAGMLQTRCEVARPLSEWPVTVIQWGRATAGELERVSRGVTGAREVRLCAGVTGRNNVLVIAWVKSLTDVQRFEVRLAQRVPGLEITDRAVALWPLKLSGHLLDEQGYRIGGVPLDVRTAGPSTQP